MPADLPAIDATVYAALRGGDETALEKVFRASFDVLLADAMLHVEKAAASARVVEHAFEFAWGDRAKLTTATDFQAFLRQRVHDGAVRERSRRLSLQRQAHDVKGAGHAAGADVATADESWTHIMTALHAPMRDHAESAREAAGTSRHVAAAHLANVGKRGPMKGAIAFGVLAVLIAGGAVWQLGKMSEKDAGVRAIAAQTTKMIATKPGVLGTVPLADGSKAALGADSKLYVPLSMGETVRAVKVEGMALFTAATGQPRPFEVLVRDIKLSTASGVFIVSAFAGDSGVTIISRDADLIVDDGKTEKPLVHGASIVVGKDGKTWSPTPQALDELNGLGDGRLIFTNRPLRDVVHSFVRWYGVPVNVEDPSFNDRLTSINVPLASSDSAMQALEVAGGYFISFNGKQLSLRARKPGDHHAYAVDQKTKAAARRRK